MFLLFLLKAFHYLTELERYLAKIYYPQDKNTGKSNIYCFPRQQ